MEKKEGKYLSDQLQESSRKSDENGFFESFFENLQEPVFALNLQNKDRTEWVVTFANPAAIQLYYYPDDAAVVLLKDCLPAFAYEYLNPFLNEALDAGSRLEGKLLLTGFDNPYQYRIFKAGNMLVLQFFENLSPLDDILENFPFQIVRLSGNGIITEERGLGLKSLGLTDNIRKGEDFLELYPEFKPVINKVLSGETLTFESVAETSSGRSYFRNFFFYDKKTGGACGFIKDITEHKKALAELEESRYFLDQVTSTSPDVIQIYDMVSDKNVFVSKDSTAQYGYTAEDIKSMGVDYAKSIIHPDDLAKFMARIERFNTAAPGVVIESEHRAKNKNGNWHWVRSKGIVFKRNEAGEAIQYLSIVSDITASKNMQEEILQREEELKSLNARLEEMVSARTAELLESEARLKEAQRITKMGNWDYDILTGEVRWSDEVFAIHELDPALGAPAYENLLNNFTEPEILSAHVIEAIDSGIPYDFDTTIRVPSGEIKYVHTIGRPVLDENGKCIKLYGAIFDITERKRVEMALQKSEEHLKTITDALPLCIAYIDKEERYRFMNKTYDIWFGQNARRYLGATVRDLMGEELYKIREPLIRKGLEGNYISDEAEVTFAGLPKKHIHLEYIPDIDENGTVKGVTGLIIDITKAKLAEMALSESAEQLRFLADNIAQIVWKAGPDGKAEFYNKYWYRFSGIQDMDLFRQEGGTILHPDDVEENMKRWQHSLKTGEPFEYEHRLRRHDGEYRWFLGRVQAQRDNDGNIIMWVGINAEIHDQKMLAEELEMRVKERTLQLSKANEELIRSNLDLEQFAYVASHDLKEPLRMVSNFTKLLARKFQNNVDSEANEFMNYIMEGSTRMQALVDDLLNYSRIGKKEGNRVLVDLNEVLDIVRKNLHEQIDINAAVIESEPLPKIQGIESQLVQLFQNLAGNAIKFRGVECPVIKVSVLKQKGAWHFKVEDNGIGIDPRYMDRIFIIFQRLHTRDKYPGTGMGLAICKKIVELHGGKIWVESEQGNGSAFNFTLKA